MVLLQASSALSFRWALSVELELALSVELPLSLALALSLSLSELDVGLPREERTIDDDVLMGINLLESLELELDQEWW